MLLFLSGWPACGQAHYGEWLVTHYDFQHLDLEIPAADSSELHDLWEKHLPGKAPALAAKLLKRHPRWVVTGGAPTDNLPNLEALRAAGFSLWFLLPRSESLSRQRWLQIEREKDPAARPTPWEKQADAIRSSARQLRPFFRDHCITTLNGVAELLDGDALAAQLGIPARA